jgi:hypothetical protein
MTASCSRPRFSIRYHFAFARGLRGFLAGEDFFVATRTCETRCSCSSRAVSPSATRTTSRNHSESVRPTFASGACHRLVFGVCAAKVLLLGELHPVVSPFRSQRRMTDSIRTASAVYSISYTPPAVTPRYRLPRLGLRSQARQARSWTSSGSAIRSTAPQMRPSNQGMLTLLSCVSQGGARRCRPMHKKFWPLVLAPLILSGCRAASSVVPAGELGTTSIAYRVDSRAGRDDVFVILCHRSGNPPCVTSEAREVTAEKLRAWLRTADAANKPAKSSVDAGAIQSK